MSISSSAGRCVAFSTQDFQQRIRKMLAKSGIRVLSAKPGLSAERLESLAAEAGALPRKRQYASEPVRQAMGCLPQPVKSPASRAWQRVQPSRTSAARQTKSDPEPDKKFADISRLVQRLMGRFGTKMPRAESFLAERQNKPAEYQLLASFAHAIGQGENLDFLEAVSDFKADPTPERARMIVKTFIEPSPIDDFGLPVEDKSKKTVNLPSSEHEKKLMDDVDACIARLGSNADAQDMNALAQVFNSAETSIRKLLVINLNHNLSQQVQNELGRQVRTMASNPTLMGGFA
jgi:hypothetical protein